MMFGPGDIRLLWESRALSCTTAASGGGGGGTSVRGWEVSSALAMLGSGRVFGLRKPLDIKCLVILSSLYVKLS